MEAALLTILSQFAIACGTDAAEFMTVFIKGFLTLRFHEGGRAMILPQLVHWWMISADTQRHEDGTLCTNQEKHAYVWNIIDVWAKGIDLDLSSAFKDALIKMGMMKRLENAGTQAVQVVSQAAGDVVKGEVRSLIGAAGAVKL